jgi:hypothetical protein
MTAGERGWQHSVTALVGLAEGYATHSGRANPVGLRTRIPLVMSSLS